MMMFLCIFALAVSTSDGLDVFLTVKGTMFNAFACMIANSDAFLPLLHCIDAHRALGTKFLSSVGGLRG